MKSRRRFLSYRRIKILHEKCLPDENSWCSWQKAKATNILGDYKSALLELVFNAIKPIYEELSIDNLLNRCISDFTQNSSESFNATVWSMAPKSVSSGKVVLNIAINIAVCVYNDGLSSIMRIMEVLGMTIGLNCYNFCTSHQVFGAITDWHSKRCSISFKISQKRRKEGECQFRKSNIRCRIKVNKKFLSLNAKQNYKRVFLETTFFKLAGNITSTDLQRFTWNFYCSF